MCHKCLRTADEHLVNNERRHKCGHYSEKREDEISDDEHSEHDGGCIYYENDYRASETLEDLAYRECDNVYTAR